MNRCLTILSDSLDKKIDVLKRIQEFNEQQEKAFSVPEPDMALFDQALEEKEKLIQEVIKLDQGFETLYERVKEELELHKDAYKPQIAELKKKVTIVTELSNAVQAKEARNKKLVEGFFAKQRQNIKQSRQRSRAAYGYAQSMSAQNFGDGTVYQQQQI